MKILEEIASLNLADLMAQWMYENCHIWFGDTGTLETYLTLGSLPVTLESHVRNRHQSLWGWEEGKQCNGAAWVPLIHWGVVYLNSAPNSNAF